MKHTFFILTIFLVLSSCNFTSSKNERKNKQLLAFKTSFLAELGDEKYDQLKKEVEKGIIQKKYLNDIIYISYYEELNACGQYDGNIETNADTIRLIVNLISDEVCTSKAIDRITFIIGNPDENRKVIIK